MVAIPMVIIIFFQVRDEIYQAFEMIYPVLNEFRKP